MSLAIIRQEILREYREYDPTAPISSSNTEVNQYINWAYEDYITFAKPCVSSATTSIFVGDETYDLPNDCILPFEVYAGNTKLGCKHYYEKDDTDAAWRKAYNTTITSYIPLSYNKVETYPKKTSAGTLTFYYYQMPSSVSSATDFVIKDAEQRGIKDCVLACMHAKGRNWQLALDYFRRYVQKRQAFVRNTEDSKSGDLGQAIKGLTRSEWNKRRFDR